MLPAFVIATAAIGFIAKKIFDSERANGEESPLYSFGRYRLLAHSEPLENGNDYQRDRYNGESHILPRGVVFVVGVIGGFYLWRWGDNQNGRRRRIAQTIATIAYATGWMFWLTLLWPQTWGWPL